VIGYKDLDLKTASGNATLDKRIKNTARFGEELLRFRRPRCITISTIGVHAS
jgi:hypothetical protein